MNNNTPASNPQNKNSFGKLVKEAFQPDQKNKMFSWYRTGLLLVGFTAGIFVATALDLVLRIDTSNENASGVVSAQERCRDDGGNFDRISGNCLYTTEDRGDGCQANADCDGWCLVTDDQAVGSEGEGECSEDFHPKGCFKFMDNGMVNSICMPE